MNAVTNQIELLLMQLLAAQSENLNWNNLTQKNISLLNKSLSTLPNQLLYV